MTAMRSLALAVAASLACAACHRHATLPGEPGDGGDAILVVHPGEISYQGHPLVLAAPLADWVNVLGPPSRSVDRAGGTRIWDDLGLVARLSIDTAEGDPQVDALWVALGPAPYDFWPIRRFGGTVRVDQQLRDETSPSAILSFREGMVASDIPNGRWRGRDTPVSRLASYRLAEDGTLTFVLVERGNSW
jgi:hypothetical protein